MVSKQLSHGRLSSRYSEFSGYWTHERGACLTSELVQHAHSVPGQGAKGGHPFVQRRAEIQGIHILVGIVDVVNTVGRSNDVSGAYERS